MRRHGIQAVLTGGAAAVLYSRGKYTSLDIDFVISGQVDQGTLDVALGKLGFRRKRDHYVHDKVAFTIEFPRGPLAIGEDIVIRPVLHRNGAARALMLSATDSCRDRLAAYYFWNDRQSLMAAIEIARRNPVQLRRIKDWSEREGQVTAFTTFLKALKRGRGPR